ncbi:hypothetical protein PanWU01x14_006630, partial [Parasponia andersonii]
TLSSQREYMNWHYNQLSSKQLSNQKNQLIHTSSSTETYLQWIVNMNPIRCITLLINNSYKKDKRAKTRVSGPFTYTGNYILHHLRKTKKKKKGYILLLYPN